MQVTNENLFICFNCEGDAGYYLEFEDHAGYENAPCPSCGEGTNTLPLYYLEDMTIPQFQNVLSEYAECTPFIPLIDLTFKSFKLPHSIGCDHKLSMETKYIG